MCVLVIIIIVIYRLYYHGTSGKEVKLLEGRWNFGGRSGTSGIHHVNRAYFAQQIVWSVVWSITFIERIYALLLDVKPINYKTSYM